MTSSEHTHEAPRVAVYNLYWSTYGGGEQVAGAIAQALADDHEVVLLGPEPIDIEATIHVERDSQKGILIGRKGQMLKEIGTQARRDIETANAKGELTWGGLPHGFFFMRLTYLRGFNNMMIDMATGEPLLWDLIEVLYRHNRVLIDQYLAMNVDAVSIGEDLGSQASSIISPAMFHTYCTPTYERLIRPCREKGCHVMLHSDGYIMDLLDELIFAGVSIINPQDLCNGIDNLRRELKGRLCIRLDVDRQRIIPFGTRQEIRELIEEEVRLLGSAQGGLEFIAGIYPPTPPDHVDALACAFEEFQTYWFDGRGKE